MPLCRRIVDGRYAAINLNNGEHAEVLKTGSRLAGTQEAE